MNKFEMLRGTINFAVSFGIGNIVSDALKVIKPIAENRSALHKLTTGIGGAALGYYISDKVCDHIDQKLVEASEKVKGKIVKEEKEDSKSIFPENAEKRGSRMRFKRR